MKRLITRVLVATLVVTAVGSIATDASAARRRRDRRAPVVRISTPAQATTSEGVLDVAGAASDNVGVAKVTVGVDGQSYTLARGTTSWSLPLDSESYPDGTHVVTVKAYDRRGNVGSASVQVIFENGTPASGGGPSSTTTQEGAAIDVDSAGAWTADQIAAMLQRNGLDSTVGPHLDVHVQDTIASQVSTSAVRSNGRYTSFSAVMYLKGVNSSFVSMPEATAAHEYGHAWSLYHLYMSRQGDWTSYLEARGLAIDPRLDSSYEWGRNEIIADDFRLLFGTAEAISQRPQHLNVQIPDPRNVPGLRTFLETVWTAPA